jgi:hypothetical protein
MSRAGEVERTVSIIHTSVSTFHSESSFGDEDSIDKNSANTIKTPPMATANIEKTHLLHVYLATPGPSLMHGL